MSGRLNILSNKGYCPWNSQNLTRIHRDEEEHKGKQEREREKYANISLISRLITSRKSRGNNNNYNENFNLFESENRDSRANKNQLTGAQNQILGVENRIEDKWRKNKYEDENRDCIARHYGDQKSSPLTDQLSTNAFYLRARPNTKTLGTKEREFIREKDPMRDFHKIQEVQCCSHRKMHQNVWSENKAQCSGKPIRKSVSKEQKYSVNSYSDQGVVCARGIVESNHRKKRRHHGNGYRLQSLGKRNRSRKEAWSRDKGSEKSSAVIDSTEELRKKRVEREERERQRQDVLLKLG